MDKWELEPNYNGGGITRILSDRDIQKGYGDVRKNPILIAAIPAAISAAGALGAEKIKQDAETKRAEMASKQPRKSLNKSIKIVDSINKLSKSDNPWLDDRRETRQLPPSKSAMAKKLFGDPKEKEQKKYERATKKAQEGKGPPVQGRMDLDKSLRKALQSIDSVLGHIEEKEAIVGKKGGKYESAMDKADSIDGNPDTQTSSVDVWTAGTPNAQGKPIDASKKKSSK